MTTKDWIENNIETYTYQYGVKSSYIYWIILACTSIIFLALPFVFVDISVQEYGIIRPITEKTEIKSTITETVESIYVNDGDKIKKGDTILVFQTVQPDYQINTQMNRLDDCQKQLHDLKIMINEKQSTQFLSEKRKQEYFYFNKQKTKLQSVIRQAEKEHSRNKALFEMKVISEEEYENSYYKCLNLRNELTLFIEKQMAVWHSDLENYQNIYKETNSILKKEYKNKDHYIIRSPINGTIDKFIGIYKGSTIQTGQSIAMISPDSTFVLETFVTPKNIGFINIGMSVNIQIDSFNYNEWGTISGKVKEISSDFLTNETGKHFYKVKCTMEKNYLTLKNGTIGSLKKGMTANVHFLINRCSLFNLLYQKIDYWINPKLNKN